jgi:hypothetical protein
MTLISRVRFGEDVFHWQFNISLHGKGPEETGIVSISIIDFPSMHRGRIQFDQSKLMTIVLIQ